MRASVAIFEAQEVEVQREVKPNVPDEVFEAARRVIDNKSTEMVKTRTGIFLVAYSPNGPFQIPVSDEWLPVYVCRVRKWDSGGITKAEMEEYDSQKA